MNTLKYFTTAIVLLAFSQQLHAQVASYTFASSSGSFNSIVGGPGTIVVATTADDDNFGLFNIGFTFTFNGNGYTTFGLNANGFICMGTVPVTTNNVLSSGLNNNVISAFNNDLYGADIGAQISYQTSGNAGSRVLTVEWTNWGFFDNGGVKDENFQIKLFEGTNKIDVLYGSCLGTITKTMQVGLRGESNLDFNNRTTTTNWAATTAGTIAGATCTYSSTVKPSTGSTFEWTPPPASPKAVGAIAAVQQTGSAAPSTTANTILRLDVPVTGSLGTLTLTSVKVTSKNTSDADVATGGVKVWIGTSTGPTTQIGSGQSFSGGNATISGLSSALISGTNYIWITYDISSTAVVNDVLDARMNAGSVTITASGGATAPGTQPPAVLNPSGNKTVDYCQPSTLEGGCGGDQIFAFTYLGINYSTSACVQSPGYKDVGTTGNTTQGITSTFTLTLGDDYDYASVWIDFNDNASFEDPGELVYTGGPGKSQGGSIPISLTAKTGTHRLRIRDNLSALPTSSCSSDQVFGETKDFRVSIAAATNCSGAPASSTTISSANPACSNAPITLSLGTLYTNLGISYQWQSSSNGTTYTNISGATNATYTATQTSATYYQCKVSCSFSGLSTISTPLQVTMNPFNQCYCAAPATDCTQDDNITNVTFAGINKNSTCSANGYGNFTNLTGSAAPGTTQPISVTVGAGGTEYVSVWIDYNQNGIFDSNERTFIGTADGGTINSNISIPANALSGTTVMRIRDEFEVEPTDPCAVYAFGETEDYSMSITGCTPSIFYADADGDGYGNPNATIQACTAPPGYVSDNTDCNDSNAAIHPGATEVCNNTDDNCNSQIDEGVKITFYADADGDGYGNPNSTTQACTAPAGYVSNNTDCNDANAAVHPGATEICNGIDDNCNNQIDEGVISASITPSGTVSVCSGSSITLQANTGSGLTYQWKNNGTNISGATASSYSTTAAGSYTVTVFSGTCSATSAATTVNVTALPKATITPSGTVTVCPGATVLLSANTGSGLTYQWLNGGVAISGATASTYSTTATGSYTVQVTKSGCSKTSAQTTIKNFTVTVKITNNGSLNICSTHMVTLNAQVVTGYTFQWYKDDVAISGATGSSYIATVAGVYKYLANTPDGCSKFSPTKTVTSCKLENADVQSPRFIVYPNPTAGNFVIALKLPDKTNSIAIVRIFNALNQVIYSEEFKITDGILEREIQLGSLNASGIYFVQVTTDDQQFNQQVIYQK